MNERDVGTLSALDLNLLVYLQALLEERSVTRAGERLAISQPAMSQALRRLRRHFDDELLVRNGRCYELSALAQSLQDEVMLTCRLAARIFAAQATFDPAVADREFTLLATDQSVAVLGPSLSSALTGVGPGVRVQLRHIGVGDVARLDDVMRGADGFIAPHSIMSGYPCVELYRDDWVTVADPANSVLGRRPELTMPDLGLLRWVVAYPQPAPRHRADRARAELPQHRSDRRHRAGQLPVDPVLRHRHRPDRLPAGEAGRPARPARRPGHPAPAVPHRSAGRGAVVASHQGSGRRAHLDAHVDAGSGSGRDPRLIAESRAR